jgi:hypothetical protein
MRLQVVKNLVYLFDALTKVEFDWLCRRLASIAKYEIVNQPTQTIKVCDEGKSRGNVTCSE